MKNLRFHLAFAILFLLINTITKAQKVFYVDAATTYVLPTNFNPLPIGGDTIKISSERVKTLQFRGFEGIEGNPIVFINDGGQVHINTNEWGALRFVNCKYVKVSGTGDPNIHYGFKLLGLTSGLSFEELSSDCEVEFIEIAGLPTTFFGIFAKKDYKGTPPTPYPIFKNLSIHDTYIHDLGEGMYIGETTSPGMEFHHLRIYNNIVVNTLRESVQIANSVNDVEIYNNFFMNAGLENLLYQDNGLQIGNNTIANVYNNIIINPTGLGIIILANGDVTLKNNYIKNSKGLFNDSRFTIHPFSLSRIENNFFDEVNNTQVISNYNEQNDLLISNNAYSPDILFFKNSVIPEGLVEINNNQFMEIVDFLYTIENGIFGNSTENPLAYQAMGPQSGLGHTYNEMPILQTIDNILIECSTNNRIIINATVADQDILHFETRDLPVFIQLLETTNGQAELIINPLFEHIGIYEFSIMVYDESHQSYDRQKVQLSVMNPDNHAPELSFETSLVTEALSKVQLEITAFDADNDSLSYSLNLAPTFAKIITIDNKVFLDLQPKLSDSGTYTFEIIADDGYGLSAIRELNLNITAINLVENRVLYRVNIGGPELAGEPINWEADLENSVPVYGTTYFLRTGSWSWNGVNTTSAPNNLFGPFRYDGAGGTEIQYEFPVPAAGRYRTKLFFAERSSEVDANLTATFNVFIENTKILDSFNIYQTASYQALELSFETEVKDQILNLDFQQIENNAKINGIEISYLGEVIENLAPEIQALAPIVLNENEVLEIPVTILDDHFESCNLLDLSAITAPNYLSIVQSDSGFSVLLQPNFEDSGIYENIILQATDGCLSSIQAVSITVLNNNRLPIFDNVDNIVLQAGNTLSVDIQAHDADNELLSIQMENAPTFVQFTDLNNGAGTLNLMPDINVTGQFAIEISATDEQGGSSTLILNLEILSPPASERILLNSEMITDLVEGGSRYTPLYLVNEQDLDPFLNEHPRSKNWIPSRYVDNSPFMTMIDLGEEFFIDFAFMHDMQNSGDLHFSVGSPDQWTEVASYNTSDFKKWNQINLQANSRYLLLSMYNTVDAQINELALYGYALNASFKSKRIESQKFNPAEFSIYPNPAKKHISIKNKLEEHTVEVLNINGEVLIKTQDNILDIEYLVPGIYLLRLRNDDQVIFQTKFIKN